MLTTGILKAVIKGVDRINDVIKGAMVAATAIKNRVFLFPVTELDEKSGWLIVPLYEDVYKRQIHSGFMPVESPRIFGPRISPSNCCRQSTMIAKIRALTGLTNSRIRIPGMAPINRCV